MELFEVFLGRGDSMIKLQELRGLGTFETEVEYSVWRVRYQVGEGRDEAGERTLNAARKN